MGALHDGHRRLIETARRECSTVAVSIFVNPLQFAPTEDLSTYPRDPDGDATKVEAAGARHALVPIDEVEKAFAEAEAELATATAEVARTVTAEQAATTEFLAIGAHAVARSGLARGAPTLVVGDLTVDTRSQTVRRANRAIPVTVKEYALLEYLARNAGRVVGRAELCEHVWDENHDPFSNALEVYINRLRKKVDEGSGAPLIHTHRGAGYRLEAQH